jgi:hypothetical protein
LQKSDESIADHLELLQTLASSCFVEFESHKDDEALKKVAHLSGEVVLSIFQLFDSKLTSTEFAAAAQAVNFTTSNDSPLVVVNQQAQLFEVCFSSQLLHSVGFVLRFEWRCWADTHVIITITTTL